MASQLLRALLPYVVILVAGIMGGAYKQSRTASLDLRPARWWVDTCGHELSNPAPDGALTEHDRHLVLSGLGRHLARSAATGAGYQPPPARV
jgi:hypothetical protein